MAESPATVAKTAIHRRIERYLDQGIGSCYLRDVRIATLVQDAFRFFDGERYRLHAWAVMPNHAHVLFTPVNGHVPSRTIHSWKSYTATRAHRILQRSGRFWQREYHDRYIRDEVHFFKVRHYIEENPVKAGLCRAREEWRFSSAFRADP